MAEPYSPLRYPGGKSKLSRFLIHILQHNGLHQPHYVEPYAGGAGAALHLLFEEYVETITINDADPRIRCFWESVTRNGAQFLEMLEKVDVTVSEWVKQREIYTKCDLGKVVELGFAAFFLNRTTRSGILHNGGPIGGHRQDGNYKVDARFNREQLARRIQRIELYADRINVTGDDGLALLKRINRSHVQAKNTFVYLDPPYYAKGAELYLNRFTHDQHAALATYLSSRKNFPWIMTYDNVEPIRALYAEFPQIAFNLSYSAYERREGQELLVHPTSIAIPDEARRALPLAA